MGHDLRTAGIVEWRIKWGIQLVVLAGATEQREPHASSRPLLPRTRVSSTGLIRRTAPCLILT